MSRDSPVEIGEKIIPCWENSNKGRLITSQPFLLIVLLWKMKIKPHVVYTIRSLYYM